MTINRKATAPTLVEGILDLVGQYGESIRAEHLDLTAHGRRKARLRTCELYAEIGATVRSRVAATPGIDEQLDAAFAVRPTQDDHAADYGIDLGPTPALRHGLRDRSHSLGVLRLACVCGDPAFTGHNWPEIELAFTAHCEVGNAADLDPVPAGLALTAAAALTPDSPDLPASPADLAAAFPADPDTVAAMELTADGQLAETDDGFGDARHQETVAEAQRAVEFFGRRHRHPGDARDCFCDITADELAAQS